MPSESALKARDEARVCLGQIVAPHGVRGQVKIKTFTSDPANLVAYGATTDEGGGRRFEITLAGRTKGGVIARLAGIEDRDAAAALKGTRLYVARAALPDPDPDEYYHADLIGLAVELDDGRVLGRVKAVQDLGAGDLLEVALPGGGTVMAPFTKEVVPVVDLEAGRLVLRPLPGLLDEVEP